MSRAGYVLVGGRSTRMGRDKALLPVRGGLLVQRVADVVRQAAGNVTLVGDPERYGGLGLAVTPDLVGGCGPLGGIHAALAHSTADWTLVVACDMPALSTGLLSRLLAAAEDSGADVIMPAAGGRAEPLCAAWNRTAFAAVEKAIASGTRKVTDAAAALEIVLWPVPPSAHFTNLNTPEEWAAYAPD